ncbi:MAG TPA: thiamine pyrophosphate-dependent dehydrogenase E1 component subunit alpha [Gaiellaceae bacterium]|nr:thiamine pyrophosphate-dependent dehydrogenase E1 component subunit alpha [Gaiellaceae bacterium]
MPTEPCADAPEVGRETRLQLLRLMLLQRYAEERIMSLYRQGRIVGSVYTGYQQEAVGAGAGLALGPDDVALPLNREQACHYARGVPVAHVLRNFLGKATGPTFGRDGNMHFGVPEHGIFPLVSMLGDLCPVAVGAALAFKRRREPRVALTFFGDGAMSTGDVHEAINLAAVLQVPVVFVVQSNQYAYSTPTNRQTVNTNLAERLRGGWSIACERVDGTDALAVYTAARAAIERARAGGGPQAIEAVTLRGHGHAAHDDARYVPSELRERFQDPIERLAARLAADGLAPAEIDAVRQRAREEVAAALDEAEAAPAPDPATLLHGVYADPISS